ncbi:SH3 domain-containing protein [Lysobacter soli]|uniref:SH3 domain-containing protein n=1 Tax=Lysobacter soli TaxID=453783 RepID=UPI0036850249
MTGKHAVGLNVRAEPSGRSQILGLLLRDSVIEVGERSTDRKWARIAKVVEGGIDSVRSDGSVPPEAASGWVFLAELDPEPTPVAFDEVVVLDEPHVVKQGDVLGYLGEDVPSRANPIANQPVSRRLLHLEVFSGDDVPAYLAASRQWAATTLTDRERTLLLLRPGDTLHTEPNGAVACTLNWAQILSLSTLESKEVDGQRWRKPREPKVVEARAGRGDLFKALLGAKRLLRNREFTDSAHDL